MKKTWIFAIILCLLGGSVFAYDVLVPANVSCRTDKTAPDTNKHDSSKLSIRSDNNAAKSWIKFDQLNALENRQSVRKVLLRLTLYESRAGSNYFDVSAVNDDYRQNIGWAEREITWNNAPANDTASNTGLLANAASLMGRVTFTDGVEGQQFFVDVTDAFKADTDGILQFVLHNSSALIQICTHDQSGTMLGGTVIGPEAARPTLIVSYPPLGADWPVPEVGETVKTSLASLSWTNPEPNDLSPVTCTVYLGTDPNRLNMDKFSPTEAGVTTASINETNFPKSYDEVNGRLYDNTKYYWYVDCRIGETTIPGEQWYFFTYDNEPPVVNVGEEQAIWLTDPNTVNLVGDVKDDGLPSDPGTVTVKWTLTEGPATAVIGTPDQLTTTVTFTERGDYTFTLTADDGELKASASVRVVVGTNSCDASHLQSGEPYNPADVNEDCVVNLDDLQILLVDDWLNCTDNLTDCL